MQLIIGLLRYLYMDYNLQPYHIHRDCCIAMGNDANRILSIMYFIVLDSTGFVLLLEC